MNLFHNRLFSSFTYLNITQFTGALNDNVYKLLIIYFLINIEGIENSPKILSISGAVFVLPFLLFSASSGLLADRFSKRNIIVLTKLLELVIMAFGILFFAYESVIGSYFVLFCLATQSALFGPSKYGIIPELVSSEKISEANGLLTSFTFLAIIFGTFSASFVTDISGHNFVLAILFCAAISLIGVMTSYCIEHTPPSGSNKRFNIFFLKEIYSSLKLATEHPSLLMSIIGSAFFLFLGAYLQLNLIPYAVASLNMTDVQGGYLFLITALGIGSGSFLAGKISGKTAELGIVPLAGFCVALSCFMLDLYSTNLFAVVPFVALAGFFGGIYEIPLDSYIQISSPNESRGQIIAATNFMSFFGVLLASAMLYLNTEVFGFSPAKGFTIIGIMMLFVNLLVAYRFYDYVTRFVGMLLSKLHFDTVYYGVEKVPDTAALYVCKHTDWNDTLLMLGSQRNRMRFFVEHERDHSSKWLKRLYRLLRVVLVPTIEPMGSNKQIQKLLKKGISVCIFTNNDDVIGEIAKLKAFDEIAFIPMIPVYIEKGEKEMQPKLFTRLRNRLRIPASITFS